MATASACSLEQTRPATAFRRYHAAAADENHRGGDGRRQSRPLNAALPCDRAPGNRRIQRSSIRPSGLIQNLGNERQGDQHLYPRIQQLLGHGKLRCGGKLRIVSSQPLRQKAALLSVTATRAKHTAQRPASSMTRRQAIRRHTLARRHQQHVQPTLDTLRVVRARQHGKKRVVAVWTLDVSAVATTGFQGLYPKQTRYSRKTTRHAPFAQTRATTEAEGRFNQGPLMRPITIRRPGTGWIRWEGVGRIHEIRYRIAGCLLTDY